MAKKSLMYSLLISSFLSLVPLSVLASVPDETDESPLEELIPLETQVEIDQRKEGVANGLLKADDLSTFMGSREIDLRHRDTAVKQQFSAKKCAGFRNKVGTCSAFGLAAVIENAMGGGVHLSERHFWSQYCRPSSAAAMKAITNGGGIIEEEWWPESRLNPLQGYLRASHFKLYDFKLLGDNVKAMLEALDQGNPVYLALNTPSEMYAKKAVISAGSGKTGGGHAVAIVGYRIDETVEGGAYLLVKNSWGSFGELRGYQWLSVGYCARKGNYCTAWSIDRAGKNQ